MGNEQLHEAECPSLKNSSTSHRVVTKSFRISDLVGYSPHCTDKKTELEKSLTVEPWANCFSLLILVSSGEDG